MHTDVLRSRYTNKVYLGVLIAVVALLRLRLLDDAVEQLAPRAQLRHEVDEAVVLVDVVQLDDARVVHAPEDLDLAPQALDPADLALLDGLDCETLRYRGRRKNESREKRTFGRLFIVMSSEVIRLSRICM